MDKNAQGKQWSYVGRSLDSESFQIDGIDVWKHPWTQVDEPHTGVKDPLYNQDYSFTVFEFEAGSKTVRFAAGEFSNGAWGFYVQK